MKDVPTDRVVVLAIRGNDGSNDLGVFDDRAYVVYDHTLKGTWQMNTDPSSNVTGRANLKPGIWKYRAGDHKGRAAFVQAEEVTVHRHNQGDDTGAFAINLHDAKGGTSSLGCQTWRKTPDWSNKGGTGFRDVVYRILKLTPKEAIGHKAPGVGRWFYYILVTLAEAEALLKS